MSGEHPTHKNKGDSKQLSASRINEPKTTAMLTKALFLKK